jgi:hypothetical protein
VAEEQEGLFVRETFPNESFCDFYFPANLGQAGPITDLVTSIEELIARDPGREIMAVEHLEDLTEFAERRIRDLTPVSGAVPYSIPERLI